MAEPARKKLRQYSEDMLKFGFVPSTQNQALPFCLICHTCLSNESMKPGRLENHLTTKHPKHASSPLEYFKSLKEKFGRRTTVSSLFAASNSTSDRVQEASFELSLLIAKLGQSHTLGEQLVKPAISTYIRIVQKADDKEIRALPLSNNTVSRRIDRMAKNVEQQLVDKLRYRNFSLQLDESTIRDGEALLLAYVRYIDEEDLNEEMLFCKDLTTTTTAADIFKVVQDYLSESEIPIENIVSCAADGAPSMIGKQNGFLKMLKDRNPEMLTIHCVIHREHLVAKKLTPALHDVMMSVIRCINHIKGNSKHERLFKQFCLDQQEEYVRLLLHTEVRWLSKGRCLQRFMELYDTLGQFLNDFEEMKSLKTLDGKTYVSYLTDIFELLNGLNLKLQGKKITLLDAKEKILGFVKFLRLAINNLQLKRFDQFAWLKKCKVSSGALKTILEHLRGLIDDFNKRFSDLIAMNISLWINQPFAISLEDVELEFQQELAEVQSSKTLESTFRTKGVLMWLDDEVGSRYPRCASHAKSVLVHFPSSYLVECGFSAVNDMVTSKRNRLEITQRGDLRLKLTSIAPEIKKLCAQQTAQISH